MYEVESIDLAHTHTVVNIIIILFTVNTITIMINVHDEQNTH